MRRVRFNILLWSFIVALGGAVVLIVQDNKNLRPFVAGLKDSKEFSLVLVSALIADLFARRAAFRGRVEQLCNSCNEAVQEALGYTRTRATPKVEDWQSAISSLSASIDEVRTVFSNVGVLYPFENLKSILYIVRDLDPNMFSQGGSAKWPPAHAAIVQLWRQMRESLLAERPITCQSQDLLRKLDELRRDAYYTPLLAVLSSLPSDPQNAVAKTKAAGR